MVEAHDRMRRKKLNGCCAGTHESEFRVGRQGKIQISRITKQYRANKELWLHPWLSARGKKGRKQRTEAARENARSRHIWLFVKFLTLPSKRFKGLMVEARLLVGRLSMATRSA